MVLFHKYFSRSSICPAWAVLVIKTCYFQIFLNFWPLILFSFPRGVLSWPFVFKQLLKLNWMFYVLSPTFRGTTQKSLSCFHTCSHTAEKNETTQKSFPIPSWCTPTPARPTSRTREFSSLSNMWVRLQLCIWYLSTYGKCAPAEIFNASDYQKQIFGLAFYSSIMV